MNAEFIDNGEIKSVLEIMFDSATSVASELEDKKIFLREVLPMMINAGAKINPAESVAVDDEYQEFRRKLEESVDGKLRPRKRKISVPTHS